MLVVGVHVSSQGNYCLTALVPGLDTYHLKARPQIPVIPTLTSYRYLSPFLIVSSTVRSS
jgi:hypothetical protein